MSLQRLVIDAGSLSADGFKSVCDLSPGQLPALQNLVNYLSSMPDQQSGLISICVGAVQASGTITSTGVATAAQAMTLLNVTLTAHGSVAANNQFVVNATPAIQAANIAACINSSTSLAGKVVATALEGVVTVTSVVPGLMANGLQISAGNLSNVSVDAFTGGSDGTSYSLDLR